MALKQLSRCSLAFLTLPSTALYGATLHCVQVFSLQNVFINDRGSVIDSQYYYRHVVNCK